jgi:hypothetical protein
MWGPAGLPSRPSCYPWKMSTLAVLLALLLQAAPVQQLPTLDAVTRSQADGFDRKLEQVRQRAVSRAPRKAPATVQVSDAEVNAWLRSDPANRPNGVSEMTVRFEAQRIVARGLVDIDLLKPKMKLSPWNPLSWISGIVPVEAAGAVASGDGKVRVEWEQVTVSSIPISVSMLRELVLSSTRSSKRYPGGLDITAPYPLPYEVKRIRLESARAIIDY